MHKDSLNRNSFRAYPQNNKRLEGKMSALMKDIETKQPRTFAAEVYEAHEDVTAEGVKQMRDLAHQTLSNKKWKRIDGVGQRKIV